MEFRLLGPLEAVDAGRQIPLGAPKQRALLALLLLARGRPVSIERLTEAIWADDPPETATRSLRVYVSGLRRAIGHDRIATRDRGYELVLSSDDAVDLDRFDDLRRAASGLPAPEAREHLSAALALVRGRPLADLELELWTTPEVGRIEERVLSVTEASIDARLALGEHRRLVTELEALVDDHPYRERFLEQLMLVLYRSGRQAEALRAYRRGATRLRNDLGLEPGRPLQEIEAAILRHDPGLEAPAVPSTSRARRAIRRRTLMTAVAAVFGVVAVAAAVGMVGAGEPMASIPAGVAIVDTKTKRIRGTISTDEIRQPTLASAGSGSFWVWNTQPFSLARIDPETGEVLTRISSPFSGDANSFLVDGESVWFTRAGELVKVDVGQGRAVERWRLVKGTPEVGLWGVARCAGSLWVADHERGQVLRVAPSTGRVEARISPPGDPEVWDVVCGDGGLWVSTPGAPEAATQRIDPASNAIVAATPLSGDITVGGGYLWVSDQESGQVSKVDPDGATVATYEVGAGATGLAFAEGTAWVASQDARSATGIDALTGETTTFRFGHPVAWVGALGDSLLVAMRDEHRVEDVIDALGGDVAKLIVPTYSLDPPDPALATGPWALLAEGATCSQLLRHTIGGGQPGDRLVPDLAAAMPRISPDRRTYTFTVQRGRRFAPPANGPVTAGAIRRSIERALSPRLATGSPGARFLSDIEGSAAVGRGTERRVRGIRVDGDTISFTLERPADDFLERLTLPFFCAVPPGTATVQGGVSPVAPPSAGPYYMSDHLSGEYTILKRNPNFPATRPNAPDAIVLREGISDETAVALVDAGTWDGALLYGRLFAEGGQVQQHAEETPSLRYEVLPVRDRASNSSGSLYALLSRRLGCDSTPETLDLAALCLASDE